jgi:hypothetical protein
MPFIRLKKILLLLKKQLLEQRKFYLFSLVALFVALCIINMLFYYSTYDVSKIASQMFTIVVCNFGFLTAVTFITAGSFYEIHKHNSSITYLQLPVTYTERVAVNLIVSFVLMPLAVLAVIYGTDWLFITVYNARHVPRYHLPPLQPGLFFGTPFTRVDFALLFLVLNGIYFAGAAWFKRLNWLLTTITAVFFLILVVLINIMPSLKGQHDVIPVVLSLSNFAVSNGEAGLDKQFPVEGFTLLRAFRIFLWCMPLLLTVATYFRLKEKQV